MAGIGSALASARLIIGNHGNFGPVSILLGRRCLVNAGGWHDDDRHTVAMVGKMDHFTRSIREASFGGQRVLLWAVRGDDLILWISFSSGTTGVRDSTRDVCVHGQPNLTEWGAGPGLRPRNARVDESDRFVDILANANSCGGWLVLRAIHPAQAQPSRIQCCADGDHFRDGV